MQRAAGWQSVSAPYSMAVDHISPDLTHCNLSYPPSHNLLSLYQSTEENCVMSSNLELVFCLPDFYSLITQIEY